MYIFKINIGFHARDGIDFFREKKFDIFFLNLTFCLFQRTLSGDTASAGSKKERSRRSCVARPAAPAASSPCTPTASPLRSQHARTSPVPSACSGSDPGHRGLLPPGRPPLIRWALTELGVFTAVPGTRRLPAPAALGVSRPLSAACSPRFPPTALLLAHLRTGPSSQLLVHVVSSLRVCP